MAKIEGLLGLACRAGQITLGAEMALREIRAGRAGLALLDADASEGTQKKIRDACAYRQVPLHILPGEALSQACGREGRMAGAVKPGKLCGQMLLLLSSAEQSVGECNKHHQQTQNNAMCGGASVE